MKKGKLMHPMGLEARKNDGNGKACIVELPSDAHEIILRHIN